MIFKKKIFITEAECDIIYIGYDRLMFVTTQDKYYEVYSINKLKELLSGDTKYLNLRFGNKIRKVYINKDSLNNINKYFEDNYKDLFDATAIHDFNEIIDDKTYDCRLYYNKESDEITILSSIVIVDKEGYNKILSIPNGKAFAELLDTINSDIMYSDNSVYTIEMPEDENDIFIRKDFDNKYIFIYNGDDIILGFEFYDIKYIEAKIYGIINKYYDEKL